MSNSWKVVGLCALASAATGYFGSRLGPTPRVAQAASEPAAPAPAPIVLSPTTARLDGDDRATMHALLEEMKAQRVMHAAPAAPGASAAVQPPKPDVAALVAGLEPEQRVVYDSVKKRVSDGITRGTWGNDDRTSMRLQLHSVPVALWPSIMGPLIFAVNHQQMHVDGPGLL